MRARSGLAQNTIYVVDRVYSANTQPLTCSNMRCGSHAIASSVRRSSNSCERRPGSKRVFEVAHRKAGEARGMRSSLDTSQRFPLRHTGKRPAKLCSQHHLLRRINRDLARSSGLSTHADNVRRLQLVPMSDIAEPGYRDHWRMYRIAEFDPLWSSAGYCRSSFASYLLC